MIAVMPVTRHTCPRCHRSTEIPELPLGESVATNLPSTLLKAAAITAATVVTIPIGGFGGILVGGALYGRSIYKYVNGKKITCRHCGHTFTGL